MGGCKWDPAWANPFPWAQPLPGKPGRVFCSLCGTDFSCDKGVFSVKQHEGGNKHDARAKKAALEQSNKKGGPSKQGTMESAVRKAEAAAVKQRRIKDQARVAEAKIATLIATHDLPLRTVDCLAELLPKIITDSEIVKEMSLHRAKACYVLRFSVAEGVKEKLLKQMRKWPWSLNFDESVKGGRSQMELVVIFRNSADRIQRSHLLTVDMKGKLTGENISKTVFSSMDEMNIPYQDLMVSDRTDGCSTMTGIRNGCHVNSKKMVRFFQRFQQNSPFISSISGASAA